MGGVGVAYHIGVEDGLGILSDYSERHVEFPEGVLRAR